MSGVVALVLTLAGGSGGTAAAANDSANLTVAPIAGKVCSFTNTWLAPRGATRQHEGVDIIAKAGVPIVAVVDGTISRLKPDSGTSAGNHINVRVAGGSTYFVYLHLQSFAPGMAVGTPVVAGQLIGYVGSTGATTPHLHFEVHPGGGGAVDPTPYVLAVGTCGQTSVKPPSTTTAPTTLAPPVVATTSAPAPATTSAPPSTAAPATAAPATVASTTAPPATLAPKASTAAGAGGSATPAPATPAAPTATTVKSTATTAAKPATTVATPLAPTTVAPAPTTIALPPTTIAVPEPVVETTQPAAAGTDILLTGSVDAYQVVSARLINGPGLPSAASSVELSITVTSDGGGRAMAMACGSEPNFNYGTALNVASGNARTRLSVTPDANGKVCFMADINASFRVTVVSFN